MKRRAAVLVALLLSPPPATAGPLLVPGSPDIDLTRPFATRSPWHLDIDRADGGRAPGEPMLCLHRSGSDRCDGQLRTIIRPGTPFALPHDVTGVDLVRPRGDAGEPLLMIRTASMQAGDGDRFVLTQLLAYRPDRDEFENLYAHVTGSNNDQEVRYVGSGPLRGDVISAEPTRDAPFAFRITVSRVRPGQPCEQVLTYRSATRYGDGNPLRVIDSDMAETERRLGLWHPGMEPPLPTQPCPKPHLRRMELWCG